MDAVLFVDDEVNVLSSLRRGLIDEDYECFFASSGKEALEIMKRNVISVICTDMRMPEMDGLTLLKEVKAKYPKTVRVVLSGYTQLQQVLATVNQGDIFKFITKPWKMEEEFKVVIQQALDYYRLQAESEELRKSLESKNQAYQNILKNIDEIIASAKTDVQIAKGLGMHTVEYIGSLLESGKRLDDVKAEVKAIIKIYDDVMNIAAADYRDVNFKELLKYYVTELRNKKQVARADLTDDTQINKIRIKPELVSFVLATLEEYFIYEEGRYYLKFLCEDKSVSSESGQIELTILISCLSDNNTAVLKDANFESVDAKILMFNKYINEMIKSYKGNISAARVDINIRVKMQLQFKK